MRPLSLFIVALAGLVAVPALAQAPAPQGTPTRIRGTVEKLDGHDMTVKTKDGQSATVALADNVVVQYLVKKSLSDIKSGDFLASTGMKGTDGKIHAIEVRIFPKATPDGGRQFAWDLGPDSVMTNATVGTVSQTPNGQLVHVTFNGGESEYTIGPDVPILAGVDGDTSLLKPGVAVFVIALKHDDGTVTSGRLYVEKDGIKPPM
ncbi:MAG TPA: hypothetical protein VN900_06115 [Stellaceae bacterium]|jgi:hypothetical protein|nr:hypothetical protein [Stellaceae bacterium]